MVRLLLSRYPRLTTTSSTYGASSRCVYFIYQTAADDHAKITSWGCDKTPTTYIVGPLQAEETSSTTAAVDDERDSISGISKDAKIVLAVVLPLAGLGIIIAAAMLFLRQRKKRVANGPKPVGGGPRSEMEQTTERAPVTAVPPYEMGNNVLRPELDSREVRQ
ncbi:uncharacterized protein FFB14_10356 [Fusarium fujikuroi]|nr:uncharacterized protein FFB14_10356 [Fusarium fujikuroi]